MIPISNDDYAKVVRLLTAFADSPSRTKKESESRRMALCLLRKWERIEKRRKTGAKTKDI